MIILRKNAKNNPAQRNIMLPKEIIQCINNDLAEEFSITQEVITPDADVRQTLNLDSMRALQIVIIVKRHCGIIIPPRHIPRFTTFQTLYDYIDEKMQQS